MLSLAKRAPALVLMLGLAALTGCGANEPAPASSPPLPAKPLRSPQLRHLEAQANRLLDGGPAAFKARIAELRGHPIVVNQWASWCPPCRHEFPFFRGLARKYRGQVAFLGVDSQDNRADARKFLARYPTPYPHYFDPDAKVARVFNGGVAWPTTAFYRGSGALEYTRAGGYATEAKLDEDIRRYALGG